MPLFYKNTKGHQLLSVLIPDGGNETSLKVLRCLGALPSLKAHVLSRDRFSADRFSRHCTRHHYHTSVNDDEWMDNVYHIVHEYGIDVLLPITIEGIDFVARNIQKILSFVATSPVPDHKILNISRDKWQLHEFLINNGLPSIPSVFLGAASQNVSAFDTFDIIKYPALLKPTRGRGGAGIVLVKTPADFEAAWNDKRIKRERRYMLQTFIPGIEYSLSMLAENGEIKAYTLYAVRVADSSNFRIGKLVEYIENESILELGRKITSILHWNGVADIDILVDHNDTTPRILEINPRFWQSVLGGLIAGVNFPYLACLSAIGQNCQAEQKAHSRFCRPSLYLETLRSVLTGKGNQDKIRWKESSLKYTCADPIPEIADGLQRLFKKVYLTKNARRKMAKYRTQEIE